MKKENKIKHKCKECAELSKICAESSKSYAELSKKYADKCRCEE